jgi:hypothetical protein
MKNYLTNQKGVGIIAAILIMLIVGVMGATIASLAANNTMTSVNYLQSQKAFFLAESGVQAALLQLSRGGGAWTGWSGTDPKTIQLTLAGYGDYDISVATPSGTSAIVTATGSVPTRTAANKAVRVVTPTAVSNSLFGNYAGFAGGSAGGATLAVNLSGTSRVDSYDSSLGAYGGTNILTTGNIGTNADIKIVSGTPFVSGAPSTGPSGVFSDASHTFFSGTVTHTNNQVLPAVVVPASLTGLTSLGSIITTASIGPGNWKYSTIATTNKVVTITGPVNIYLTGSAASINITSTAQITIVSGPVIFYVDGTITLGTVSGVSNPSNLQIYDTSTSATAVSITSPAFFGVVYAPKGNITITSSAVVSGSFIGDTLTISGSSTKLHHDIALKNLSTPSFLPSGWKITNWKEIY